MSKIKISENLYLETLEFSRFYSFLDDQTRSLIKNNASSFGLTSNAKGYVTESLSDTLGQKTVKINDLLAIDSDGLVLNSYISNNISIPSDSRWYWLIVYQEFTHIEKGTWSIDSSGNLTGINGELLTIFRQQPNFPTRIRFTTSQYNTQEYDVLSVVSDNQAVLQGSFQSENNLTIEIVGTFTPGMIIPSENKRPFYFDNFNYRLTPETQLNTRPSIISDKEFCLARIKSDGTQLTIQDKRSNFFSLKGSVNEDISSLTNPILGPEFIKYPNYIGTGEFNQLRIGFGINSDNWNINTESRRLTLNNAYGGIIKNITDFSNNSILVGWRVYTKSGNYYTIQSTRTQGSSISLVLDKLDINEFSSDGGATFLNYTIKIVPPVEEIEFKLTPTQGFSGFDIIQKASNTGNTYIDVPLPFFNLESSCYYVLEYRMKNYSNYGSWNLPVDDNQNGYLTENSFSKYGILLDSASQERQTYTASNTIGFIKINRASWSFYNFKSRVDKDMQCVKQSAFADLSNVIKLFPGQDCSTQVFSSSVFIKNFSELYISLESSGGLEGHTFNLILKDDLIVFPESTKIYIVQDFVKTGDYSFLLKELTIQDIYIAKNSSSGITLTCKFDGNKWIFTQPYSQPRKYEVIMYHGDNIANDFDLSSGMGKTKGWIGHAICDGRNGTPDLSEKMPMGYGNNYLKLGSTGGDKSVKIKEEQMPKHTHLVKSLEGKQSYSSTSRGILYVRDYDTTYIPNEDNYETFTVCKTSPVGGATDGEIGSSEPLEIIPPYTVVLFVKQLY